jgi:hypothetical protein
MLKRTTTLAVAAGLALAVAPAQAEAQAPSDAIQPIIEGLPSTPSLPPELSPDVEVPPIGNLTVPINPPYLNSLTP